VTDAATLLLLASTLRLATPLALAAMGELVAERAGVLNVGIEGMMIAGALASFAVGVATGSPVLAILAAIGAGVALAALFALFVLHRGADPIVSGTALNVLALGGSGVAFRVLQPAGGALERAPQLAELAPGVHPFALLALALVGAVALFLGRTRAGLALRAVGERADAADAQGVPVLACASRPCCSAARARARGRHARALDLRHLRRGHDQRPRLHRALARALRRLPPAAHPGRRAALRRRHRAAVPAAGRRLERAVQPALDDAVRAGAGRARALRGARARAGGPRASVPARA
jgi:hypothetical protein